MNNLIQAIANLKAVFEIAGLEGALLEIKVADDYRVVSFIWKEVHLVRLNEPSDFIGPMDNLKIHGVKLVFGGSK